MSPPPFAILWHPFESQHHAVSRVCVAATSSAYRDRCSCSTSSPTPTCYAAIPASDRLTYTPNRASWINTEHLSFFKFVGRIIGKAIYDGRLLDAYFTRSMYKHILGRPVDYRDIESIDPEYYNSLVWMLQNDITDVIDQTFAVEADDFGQMKIIDLVPGGRDIPVTQENKIEYVKLITEQKLTRSIQDQIDAFLKGFYEIVPKELIQIFSDAELELLISGWVDASSSSSPRFIQWISGASGHGGKGRWKNMIPLPPLLGY